MIGRIINHAEINSGNSYSVLFTASECRCHHVLYGTGRQRRPHNYPSASLFDPMAYVTICHVPNDKR